MISKITRTRTAVLNTSYQSLVAGIQYGSSVSDDMEATIKSALDKVVDQIVLDDRT